MIYFVELVLLGLVAGAVAGLLGIGGAVMVIPALVFFFGLSQHLAQGTTLAMLVPPIGLLAAWQYYRAGNVDLKMAAILCIGFFAGGYFGGLAANHIPDDTLRRIFGGALLLIGVKMLLGK